MWNSCTKYRVIQKDGLNFVRLYGTWMIYIPLLERSPSAQPCSSVSWEQNDYYAAQDYLSLVLNLKYRLTKLSPPFWITLYKVRISHIIAEYANKVHFFQLECKFRVHTKRNIFLLFWSQYLATLLSSVCVCLGGGRGQQFQPELSYKT